MQLKDARDIVFREKPVFGGFYEKWKEKTWLEYWKAQKVPNKPLTPENVELLDIFEEEVLKILGKNKSILARLALETNFFVSTCDHHGILCHPFFLNTALGRSQGEACTVVLSCGGVSASNSSYPRGLFFYNKDLEKNRIPFLSLKYKSRPVYGIPALPPENFEKALDRASSKSEGLAEKRLGQVREMILEEKTAEKIFSFKTYSEQCSLLSNLLWKETFAGARGELIYMEIESLANSLLFQIHLKNDTWINKIIFDKKWRSEFLQNLEGVLGAHDTQKQKGSHLFWYIEDDKRHQLFLQDDKLESLDGKTSIEINPENIAGLLYEKKLLPTMALSFSIISFYHGLACGGGFSQIGYLPEMKEAFNKTLKQNGLSPIENPPTDIFTGEFILATFDKKNLPATLLDLFIYGDFDISEKINKNIEKIKIGKSIDLEMPEFYKIITGEKIEIEDLPKIPATLSQKKSTKCIYCGNNPTNHFRAYVFQTLTVPFIPLLKALTFVDRPFFQKITKIILTPYLWVARAFGLVKMNRDKNRAFTKRSEVIWAEAEKRGIQMEQFAIFKKPIEQYRAKINGSWKYFESLPLPDGGSASSYAWMDDKAILKKKFSEAEIPVAFGKSVSSLKEAFEVFDKAVKPIIVKPQLGSRGRHTTTHIYTKDELKKAYNVAKQLCHFVVVEEHLVGSVYRATYVGGEIVGILRGDPPRVTGDGEKNIKELIDIKNENKKDQVKDVLINELLKEFLARQNLSLGTILENGRVIDLSEKIGISYGGYAAEEFPTTHPKVLAYLKKAGDFLNAPVVGFDFIIKDATTDPDTEKWGIIEANSLPFINLHHFPLEGTPINVAGKVWDLWKK